MGWRYPYPFIAYTKSGTTYTKVGSGMCALDILGASRVKALTGSLTSADSLLCTGASAASLFKKDGRAVVNKGGTYVVIDIVFPDNIREKRLEVYSKYNGTVKVNETTGELA